MNTTEIKTKKSRPYLYGTVALITLTLVGWIVGQLMANSDNLYQRILLLQDVVNQVSLRYVDDIPQDNLYERALSGLLTSLDPYTEIIPEEEYKRFLELQIKSEYLGTGISITRVRDQIVVMSTFPGSSAWRKGVMPGDRIVKVNGENSVGWSTEEAKVKLLGEEGSEVTITVSRIGADQPLDFTLSREPVVVPTVNRYFIADNGIGYLRLASFTERSMDEVAQHVLDLKKEGANKLILDLRDNGGGLTESAVEISDLFLPKGELIVSMRGRNRADNKSYFAKSDAIFDNMPLAILVNNFTASSSEILAGALQDHDRAVVVGEQTFGKGLVQSTYPISTGDVLKITTARYYTPSGRNIQREHFRSRRLEKELEEEDEIEDGAKKEEKEEEKYFSDMGRELLGGGGIKPDIKAEVADGVNNNVVAEIFSTAFDFAVSYRADHPQLSEQQLKDDSKIYDYFVSYLDSQGSEVDRVKLDENKEYLGNNVLKYLIAQVVWDENTAYRITSGQDKQLSLALKSLKGAATQEEIIKNSMESEKSE